MKVIASSLRKGNVLEIDGKLYSVLTVSNFHPGKGTPTTSADLRRLSDGVKVSERWRTVEQVERVNVDEREYDFKHVWADLTPTQRLAVLEDIYREPELFQSDRIHPTAEGIERLVAATLDEVEGALPAPDAG